MGANPHANGGLLLKELKMPDFRDYALKITNPGIVEGEATRVQGKFIRDVVKLNTDQLSCLQPGRNCIEPMGRCVRGNEQMFNCGNNSY